VTPDESRPDVSEESPASDTLPPSSETAAGDPPAAVEDMPTVNLTGDELSTDVDGQTADARGSDDEGSEASEGGEVEPARELSHAHLQGLVEALIFASDKPMKDREVARLASAPVKVVRVVLAELKALYATRGIVLDEVAGGWLFRTSVQYAPFVRELSAEKPVRLTRAQVETLAIAAYRQPITRPEIDDIRGVDSGATLKLLLERDLVRILGKKDEPGRPLLYGTTNQFLEFFGLKSLKDLPTLKEFTELSEESRQVAEAELGAVLPEAGPAPVQEDTIAPPPAHDTVAPPPPATEDALEDPPLQGASDEAKDGTDEAP
jgi:segregation and condensation protein B